MSAATAREATAIVLTSGNLNTETPLVTTPSPGAKFYPSAGPQPVGQSAAPVIVRAAVAYTPDATTTGCVIKVYRVNDGASPVLLKTVSVI